MTDQGRQAQRIAAEALGRAIESYQGDIDKYRVFISRDALHEPSHAVQGLVLGWRVAHETVNALRKIRDELLAGEDDA